MTNEQWAFTIATDMTSAFHVTRVVAAEPAKYNITCNAICPGYFAMELTEATWKTDAFTAHMKANVPLERYGVEGELNASAIFLASDEASYVTASFCPLTVATPACNPGDCPGWQILFCAPCICAKGDARSPRWIL